MIARYDAIADYYDNGFSDPTDGTLTCLLDIVGDPAGRRVLDLACGHGRATRELARRGATVTGVDLSGELIARAQAVEAAEPLGIAYACRDASDPSWVGDTRVDAVLCSFALGDIDDLDGCLATVAALLEPGGAFAFSLLHPCFTGAGEVSGDWPRGGSYHQEGFWLADGALSNLRRKVGVNHRTLSTYVNTLRRYGLIIDEMREPLPEPVWIAGGRQEVAGMPVFLVARCVKAG